jgi:FdhD protein
MSSPASPDTAPPGSRAAAAWRRGGPRPGASLETLADEVPVALVVNGIAHTVMMATPTDLEDFALGFAWTEGLIEHVSELHGVETVQAEGGLELHLEVSSACAWRLKERRRTLAGRTGCGLCGVESLALVRRALPPVAAVTVTARAVADAEAALHACQVLQQATGATHAAAWAGLGGRLRQVREDVGRHNALDKLVGALLRERVDVSQGFVLVTSRASFEMVQKTVALGAGVLAAVSAPTALAVDCAHQAGLCVLGFVRGGAMTAYTCPERLQ